MTISPFRFVRLVAPPLVAGVAAFASWPGSTWGQEPSCGNGSVFRRMFDKCSTIPPGAIPAPNGSYVRAFQQVQRENAALDKFVIYLNEWYMGGTELGPWGRNHVALIAKRLPMTKYPVIIQASPQDDLNAVRQQRIIAHLIELGQADAASRVVVGFPEAVDLDGNEAPRIYQQMLTPQYGYGRSPYGSGNFGNYGGSSFGSFGGFGGMGYGGIGYGGFGSGFGGMGLFGY
jgi:hypothetical protein